MSGKEERVYTQEIERLKNPENIKEAVYASSPDGLRRAFENDSVVGRLVRAGEKVVPLIGEQLERSGLELHEITLACFAYILHQVDSKSASRILEPFFVKAMEQPGPFFVNFAAYPIREVAKLTTKPLGETHTSAELSETLDNIQGKSRTKRGK